MRSALYVGVGALAVISTPHVGLAQAVKSKVYTDPFAYCAAVGTAELPGPSYRGPENHPAVDRALGGTSVFRCQNSQVLGCALGANGRACMKKNLSRVPNSSLIGYCRSQPNSFIDYATQGYSAFEWTCRNGKPRIVSGPSSDANGYTEAWGPVPSPRVEATGTAAAAKAALGGRLAVTPQGVERIKIGMTLSQFIRDTGGSFKKFQNGGSSCQIYGADEVAYLFENNRLSRISVTGGNWASTPRGIGIGSTEAQVRKAYGATLLSEQHAYENAPAKYLTFWIQKNVSGVRFVTDTSRRVRQFHAGNGSIQYIEGCL